MNQSSEAKAELEGAIRSALSKSHLVSGLNPASARIIAGDVLAELTRSNMRGILRVYLDEREAQPEAGQAAYE